MSYIVEILRKIEKSEVLAAIEDDEDFSIEAQGENWVNFYCAEGDEKTHFQYERGTILIQRMGENFAWSKTEQLAGKLGAEIMGEEDDVPSQPFLPQSDGPPVVGKIYHFGCIWLVLCFILGGLLIWKW